MYYDLEQLSAFGFIDKISYTSGKYVVKGEFPKADFEISCDADGLKALLDTINLMIESLKEKALNKSGENDQTKAFNEGYKKGLKDGYNIGFDDGNELGYEEGFREGILPSN